jgi:DNA-binding YbaB/EbfC family protein
MSKFQNLPKGMLEQLQSLQQQLVSAQMELKGETVTGTAGGGAVQVIVTGDQKCTEVQISPELLKEEDPSLLQDLLVAAINNALEASRDLMEQRLHPLPGDSTD